MLSLSDGDFEFTGEKPGEYDEGRRREAEYIRRCQEAMTPDCEGWGYLRDRGFTDDEIGRFGFGFDPHSRISWQEWQKTAAKDRNGDAICELVRVNGPRVVIPWQGCPWYHIDRAAKFSSITGAKYAKPKGCDVGPQPIYNPDAIGSDVVFVVEGLMDALAVQAAGFQSVAVAGVSWHGVVEWFERNNYRGTVVAALDNDETGRTENAKMAEALRKAGIAVYAPDKPFGPMTKDASEALKRDRKSFADDLAFMSGKAAEEAEMAAQERYDDAMRSMRAVDPLDVAMGIVNLDDVDEPTPTGFAQLDDVLGGGLMPGVAVLGAVSSLGKTTLALQVADHMAADGVPVLFVTVEQSARELVAKSVCRTIRQRCGQTVPTRELMSRAARDAWNERANANFKDAVNAYSTGPARNLRFLEGTEQPSVGDIRGVAKAMAEYDPQHRTPVVFIDYLQLLRSPNEGDNDKQATDKNMMALRQMARDMRTPIVVISSLNRSSYSGAISLDSFKESGGIEYGADVLMGLQPYGMADRLAACKSDQRQRADANRIMAETKAAEARACELVILKNRNGAMPSRGVPLTFYAAASMFRDGVHGPGHPGSDGVRVI